MSVSTVQGTPCSYLRLSAHCFSHNRIQEGKQYFALVCKQPYQDEWGVYKALWRIKGSPIGVSEYGRHAFHDVNGLSSTAQEKMRAIQHYLALIRAPVESFPQSIPQSNRMAIASSQPEESSCPW